jgi:serine/threonine protein kinase
MEYVPLNERVKQTATGLGMKFPGLNGLPQRLERNECTPNDLEIARKIYENPDSSPEVRVRLQELGIEIRARLKKVQEPTAPEPTEDPGLTMGKMDNDFRKSGVKLLKESIFPFIEREQSMPNLLQSLRKGLEKSDQRSVVSLFVNLSAGGRSLTPPPLHLVGQALLHSHATISKWVEENSKRELRDFFMIKPPQEWLKERFTFLDESVRVELAKIKATELLQAFEIAFANKDREMVAEVERFLYVLFNFNSPESKLHQQTITFIAQMIASSRILTHAQKYLMKGFLDTFNSSARLGISDEVSEEMLVAIDALKEKQRDEEPSHSAPTQLSLKRPAKQVAQKKAPAPAPAPVPVVLPPDKEEVRTKLQNIMTFPDRTKAVFVNHLRDAVKKYGNRLGIDYEKSSFRPLGSGGTCVVIELHDDMFDKPFAARFDVGSIGEGEEAEYATELAMRAFAIHSRLNHSSIVKHIGFDSIRVHITNKPDSPSATITFQKLELIDRALSGYKIVENLQEQKVTPKPKDIMLLMHKMFDPIDFMHRMGVVHRDIKPDNLMIIPPQNWTGDMHELLRNGTLKFLDIGLARELKLQEGGVSWSKDTLIPGTLAFISPECFLDGTKTRDTANDVYALGVTLYHFITGQNETHPYNVSRGARVDFTNQNYVITSMGGLAMDVENNKNSPSIISMEDPRIQRFLAQKDPNVPMEETLAWKIVQFVMRMCDPNPANRPTLKECVEFTKSDGRSFIKEATQNKGGILKRLFGR